MRVTVAPLNVMIWVSLAALIVALGRDLQDHSPLPPLSPKRLTPLAITISDAPGLSRDLNALNATRMQPLFAKDRKPSEPKPQPPPVVVVVPTPDPVETNLRLGGVMIVGSSKKALVTRVGEPAGAWVTMGEHLHGWEVAEIGVGSATLFRNGRKLELVLYPKP